MCVHSRLSVEVTCEVTRQLRALLGRALRDQANVPWVVCWRTICDDEAARLFSVHFFAALSRAGALEEEPYRSAFYQAKSALASGQKLEGTLADGQTAAQVPKYVFSDPAGHLQSPNGARGDLRLPDSQEVAAHEVRGPSAAPTSPPRAIRAGVPVLLCPNEKEEY